MRVLAILLLTALPAAATADGWPAIYDVTGVATDDVLNVRSAPGAGSDIVGTLAHDAKGIEVIRPNDDLTWGLVNSGEGSGWVSLNFLERAVQYWDGQFPKIRQCFGTEPFWSLEVGQPEVRLNMPGAEPRDGLVSSMHSSRSRRDRFAFSGAFFPTENGSLDVQLSVRMESCNDGMSDREYGIAVDMLLTSPEASMDQSALGLYSGYCSIQPLSASR